MKKLFAPGKFHIAGLSAIVALILTTAAAHAQVTIAGSPINFSANFGDWQDPGTVISSLVNIFLAVAGLVAFLFILWGAFDYITAGDDSGKTEKARKKITNAVVGLILVALSFVIWTIVVGITGLNLNQSASTNSCPAGQTMDSFGRCS